MVRKRKIIIFLIFMTNFPQIRWQELQRVPWCFQTSLSSSGLHTHLKNKHLPYLSFDRHCAYVLYFYAVDEHFHPQSVRNSLASVSHRWEGENRPVGSPWHVNLSQSGSVKSLVTIRPLRSRMRSGQRYQTENPSLASSVGFMCLRNYFKPSLNYSFPNSHV